MLIAAGAVGCASGPAAVELEWLEGLWEWQSSSGGIAGWTLTPASEGYTMDLRLLASGEAELYRNGGLQATAHFSTGIGHEGGSFPGRDVVRFSKPLLGGWEEMALDMPDADHLVLTDGCCDGYSYSFVRRVAAP